MTLLLILAVLVNIKTKSSNWADSPETFPREQDAPIAKNLTPFSFTLSWLRLAEEVES